VDAVVTGALGELIATAVVRSAGFSWESLRPRPEGRTVREVIGEALASALAEAALPGSAVGDSQASEMAGALRSAFTTEVSAALVACLADPSPQASDRFAELALAALQDAGVDAKVADQGLWLEEFLVLLPRWLFDGLSGAAVADPAVRDLVGQLLAQRAEGRAAGQLPASPAEFRSDLIGMLTAVERRARAGRLPAYLPTGTDVVAVTRTVKVQEGLRAGHADRRPDDPAGGRDWYAVAGDRGGDSDRPLPWPQVMAAHQRLVVLGDPGLGKSWLIRTETLRLAKAARTALTESPRADVFVPVALRCDQLDAAPGTNLAAKAAAHLAGQGLLAARSQGRLAGKIAAGQVVLLLDAADELTPDAAGRVGELLRSWTQEAGEARCVVTRRVAGYTGPPIPGAAEVELQPFTPDDVAAVVAAWQLPQPAAASLKRRLSDPAVGAMARVPLMLALLCSLASDPGGQALPATRGQLYERVLRWFLTGAHRSADNPATPQRDDIAVDALLAILAPLAFTFASAPGGWTDLMSGEQVLNAIRTAGPAFTELGYPAGQVLRELSVADGILIPDSDPSAGRTPRYLFIHRTFAEYLVARHLATLPVEGWLAVIEQHRWFDPEWAQALPMLGERLAPPFAETLIQHFFDDQADPFYHSLLTAARIWGARPDADHLLPDRMAADLAGSAVGLLSHPLAAVRSAASAELAAMAHMPGPLLSLILERLADTAAFVRFAAASALTGRDSPAVTEALLKCLGADKDAGVRSAAARALAGRDSPAVTAALMGRLADGNADVRSVATGALAGRDSPEVTAALLDRLADGNANVRRRAARALADRDSPAVTAALVDRLADDNADVRSAATEALASWQSAPVTAALLDRLADGNASVRSAATWALSGRHSPEVTAALLDRLADGNANVRRRAARALAGRDSLAVTAALVDRLADTAAFARHAAAGALSGRDSPEVTAALLDRLADDHADVRSAAARALSGRDSPQVTAALLDRLADDHAGVRSAAAQALAGRDSPQVTAALLERLGVDKDAGVRSAAARALADRDSPAVTGALLDHLAHYHVGVRSAAARALSGRDSPQVTAALLDHLADDQAGARSAAVEALAGRDSPQVTAALLDRLDDNDDLVRRAAVRALSKEQSPWALGIAARAILTLPQSRWPTLAEVAGQLMVRHYLRLEPADRAAMRVAMSELSATKAAGSAQGGLTAEARRLPSGR
jgi:HEAT repeat protein